MLGRSFVSGRRPMAEAAVWMARRSSRRATTLVRRGAGVVLEVFAKADDFPLAQRDAGPHAI